MKEHTTQFATSANLESLNWPAVVTCVDTEHILRILVKPAASNVTRRTRFRIHSARSASLDPALDTQPKVQIPFV
jgi:hypothetical protein